MWFFLFFFCSLISTFSHCVNRERNNLNSIVGLMKKQQLFGENQLWGRKKKSRETCYMMNYFLITFYSSFLTPRTYSKNQIRIMIPTSNSVRYNKGMWFCFIFWCHDFICMVLCIFIVWVICCNYSMDWEFSMLLYN